MTLEFFEYLTDDGLDADGTNQKVLTDGSVTPVPYFAGPEAGKYWHISRLIMYIEGVTSPKVTQYGSTAALTNGMRLFHTSGGATGAELKDFMGGLTAKTNADWSSFCFDVNLSQPGQGNGIVVGRWTFEKAGTPVILDGNKDDKLVLLNQDDLSSSLIDHRFFIQGVETNDPHPLPA